MLSNELDKCAATVDGASKIKKIHNMPWLKRDSATYTHPKPKVEKKDKMPLPHETAKDRSNASKKKAWKKKLKAKKGNKDVTQKTEIKDENNGVSEPDKTETLAGTEESAQTSDINAAESLVPDIEEEVDEVERFQDETNRAVEESLINEERESSLTEEHCLNEAVEATEVVTENDDSSVEDQRNDSIPEVQDDNEILKENDPIAPEILNIVQDIENLTIPPEKLEIRSRSIESCVEQASHIEENVVYEELVPAYVPKFIDKWGRIEGDAEKHLFFGKGARRKEELYIEQFRLQELQKLSTANLVKDSLEDLHLKKTPTESNSQASNEDPESNPSPQNTPDFLEKIDPLLEVSVESSSSSAVQEVVIDDMASPEEMDTKASEELASSSQDSAAKQLTSEAEILTQVPSSVFQDTENESTIPELPEKTGDNSRHNFDSQSEPQAPKITEQAEALPHREVARNGRPILSSAQSSGNHQPRDSTLGQSVNRSGNRSDYLRDKNHGKPVRQYYDANYRGPRHEQNFSQTNQQPVYDNHSYPRNNRNYSKPYENNKLDEYAAARQTQNPHKWSAERHRNTQRGEKVESSFKGKFDVDQNSNVRDRSNHRNEESIMIQSSHKSDAAYNPHVNERSQSDRDTIYGGVDIRELQQKQNQEAELNSRKLIGEIDVNENDNNNDQTIRHIENVLYSSHEEVNVPDIVENEDLLKRSIDIEANLNTLVENSQQHIEETVILSENKEFETNPATLEVPKIPVISSFVSRYTPNSQEQHLSREMIPVPSTSSWSTPSVPPLNNLFAVPQQPQNAEINDIVSNEEEIQERSLQKLGFSQYGEQLATEICSRCGCHTPFEIKYATLRLFDPLLYNLLQTHVRMTSPSTTHPGNMNDFHGTPVNCNSVRPRIPEEATALNYTDESSSGDFYSQYQMYQQQQLLRGSIQNCNEPANPTHLNHIPSVRQSPTTMQQYSDELYNFPHVDHDPMSVNAQRLIYQQSSPQTYNNVSLNAKRCDFTQPPPSFVPRQTVPDNVFQSDQFNGNSESHKINHQQLFRKKGRGRQNRF